MKKSISKHVVTARRAGQLLLALSLSFGATAREMPYGSNVTNGFRSLARVAYVNPPPDSKQVPLKSTSAPAESKQLLDDLFKQNNTKALIVARGSEILYERFAGGVSSHSTPLGYSMSKSLAALAVGRALCDGHIKSMEDPLKTYVPALAGTSWGDASVRNVLRMSSGAFKTDPWLNGHKNAELEKTVGESIAVGKMTADFLDLMKTADERSHEAGAVFNYSNFDTVALGVLVEAATGMPFSKYFEKTVWADAGAESQGAWFVNAKGQTSTYNGFSARPHDWLRLGLMVLRELKSENSCFGKFLKEATSKQIDTLSGLAPAYGYQIWLQCSRGTGFCFAGFGGQYLVFDEKENMVLYHHATTFSQVGRATAGVMEPLIRSLASIAQTPR
jgi:CubicO group peptidase (beta-lactamase class C family)